MYCVTFQEVISPSPYQTTLGENVLVSLVELINAAFNLIENSCSARPTFMDLFSSFDVASR